MAVRRKDDEARFAGCSPKESKQMLGMNGGRDGGRDEGSTKDENLKRTRKKRKQQEEYCKRRRKKVQEVELVEKVQRMHQ